MQIRLPIASLPNTKWWMLFGFSTVTSGKDEAFR